MAEGYTTLIETDELAAHLGDPEWAIVDCRFFLNHPELGRKQYIDAHIPGAVNVELAAIVDEPLTTNEPVTTMCGHGERAATAASLLERRNVGSIIAVGGPSDWSATTGRPLEARS